MRSFSAYTGLSVPNTAAKFPALKMLFPCTERVGETTLTDTVGGSIIRNSANAPISDASDGCLTLGGVMNVIQSGTIPSPGTKNTVLLLIAKSGVSASGINIGNSTANGFKITPTSVGTPQVASGGVAVSGSVGLPGGTPAAIHGYALAINWGVSLESYDYDGTTFAARTPANLSAIAGLNSIDQSISIGASSNPALIAVFHFAGAIPNDIKSMLCWTRDYVAAYPTKKTLCPAWAGIS